VQTLADELDVPVHIHVHETANEVEQALAHHGQRPLSRLAQLGLLTPRLMAVHMTQLADTDIEAAANHNINVVHCPESNAKLASGMCPVAQLDAAGVNVALGTDGAASNNDLDMLGELRSAALIGKLAAQDACAIPAEMALRMATINGARALGLDERIGTLEAGKCADLVAIDLRDISTTPVYDVSSALVYAAAKHQVTHVWIDGQHIVAERQLLTLDVSALAQSANAWRERIDAPD
jgi:5-methylthioadenosine/S-adenosylhomocysteine deaminase